jgi:hypothetical protein
MQLLTIDLICSVCVLKREIKAVTQKYNFKQQQKYRIYLSFIGNIQMSATGFSLEQNRFERFEKRTPDEFIICTLNKTTPSEHSTLSQLTCKKKKKEVFRSWFRPAESDKKRRPELFGRNEFRPGLPDGLFSNEKSYLG